GPENALPAFCTAMKKLRFSPDANGGVPPVYEIVVSCRSTTGATILIGAVETLSPELLSATGVLFGVTLQEIVSAPLIPDGSGIPGVLITTGEFVAGILGIVPPIVVPVRTIEQVYA